MSAGWYRWFEEAPETGGAVYVYKGLWDPNLGAAPSTEPVEGDYWVVSASGNYYLDGFETWVAGDWAYYNGAHWTKLDRSGDARIDDVENIIEANRGIWDRAEAISETGTLLASYIDGTLTRAQLDSAIQGELDLITETRNTLALSPDDPGQFSSVLNTHAEITSTVAKLGQAPDDPTQFTAISQNAGQIETVAGRVGTSDDLADPNGTTAWSRVKQAAEDINLTVKKADLVSEINLNASGLRLAGAHIQLDGNTTVNGQFSVTDGTNEVLIGDVGGRYGAPTGAHGIAASLGSGIWVHGATRVVYADTVRVYLNDSADDTAPGGTRKVELDAALPGLTTAVVPTGKRWISIVSPVERQVGYRLADHINGTEHAYFSNATEVFRGPSSMMGVDTTSVAGIAFTPDPVDPGQIHSTPPQVGPLDAGTYDGVYFLRRAYFKNDHDTFTSTEFYFRERYVVVIYEVDA